MSDPRILDALGTSGSFTASRRHAVTGVDGAVLAELSQVPRLYIRRTIAELRRTEPMSAGQRHRALAEAARIFSGTVDGIPLHEHEREVCRASGVAMPVVRAASRTLAHSAEVAAESVAAARPAGSAASWRDNAGPGAVWARRGEVLAVHAPGNHPATHAEWIEALALGYRVAVRPSNREPFTPHRLVTALRQAGFGPGHLALLPTGHDLADELVRAADLSLVYGGDQIVERYGARADVLVQGPGRSKVLLADGDPQGHLATVVDSVVGHGGTACVNATAVFVDGDVATAARDIADALASIPVHEPEHDQAVLPAHETGRANDLEAGLRAALGGAELLTPGSLVHELPGGGAVLRPAVVLLDDPNAAQAGVELPFPCVWVAPWSSRDGIGPLRNSLVLTAVTEDEQLLARLVDEPSISNVHIGDNPTHLMAPGLPHDGHLAEFLMRSKTVLRTSAAVTDPHTRLLSILSGHWSARAVHAAAELGVADQLRDRALTGVELAARLGSDPEATARLLHHLERLGLVSSSGPGGYTTTATGDLLRGDDPFSDLARLYGGEFYQAWSEFSSSVRTGGTAFGHRFGVEHFDYFAAHPDTARTFDRAMQAVTELVGEALPGAVDFPAGSTVVDVGGGNGTLLRSVLRENSQVSGIVFDRDHVSADLGDDLGGRLSGAAGDFFQDVPPRGDFYLLSRVLHDWNDEQCLRILRGCREACRAGTRLLVLERLLPDKAGAESLAPAWDMQMLAITGGRERHRDEYEKLLATAGFEVESAERLPVDLWLLGARAV
ncbi:aldehyde dehydrogenase family protein [Saccharopolyspora sp. NFXS83]|uniref:aldehyde dehydrogenase family protein n=1 Tax=Saccharopolyspora sp. NFXS83 TaxID=2993560 RepID=UPI00224B9DFE|nr:aldehyde dehydrogenase family protein [Saccharopolyspora sp. NFXS83]MCX2729814.1 aldehyde dehydrogenase family protein [Saccharopolyspora sp. NFXS83]